MQARTADFLRDQLAMNLQCYMQVRPGGRAAAEVLRDRQTLRDELARRLRADRRAARSTTVATAPQIKSIQEAARQDLMDVLSAARIWFFDEKKTSTQAEMFAASLGSLFCEPGGQFGDFLDAYDAIGNDAVPAVLAEIAAELERRGLSHPLAD